MVIASNAYTCPTQCTCDKTANEASCNSINSTSVLEEIIKNLDNNTDVLSFSGNGLTSFDFQIYLEKLTKLDLEGNLLKSVPSDLAKKFPSLKVLLLNDNLIEAVSSDEFLDLKNVVKLNLARNRLSTIGDETFIHMPNLRQLLLTDNQISSLSSDCFKGMKSLVKLSLDKNKISVLPSGIFVNFRNSGTMNIYLTSNLLTEIPNGLFAKLTNYEMLEFSYNHITKIGDEAFKNVTATIVSLHNNLISNLNPSSLVKSSIKLMYLNENPIVCKCETKRIAEYVEQLTGKCSNFPSVTLSNTSYIEYIEDEVCTQCDYIVCHNKGVCEPIGKSDYKCQCGDMYSGKNCTVVLDDGGISPAVTVAIVLAGIFVILVLLVLFFCTRNRNTGKGNINAEKKDKDQQDYTKKEEKVKLVHA